MPDMKFLTDEEAASVMEAFRAGRTVRDVCTGKHGPQLAQYYTYRRYHASHPEFAREAAPLLERNSKLAHLRKGASRRNKTHCNRGHLLAGDNIYWFRNGRQRKCRACSLLNNLNPLPPTAEQIQRVTAALNAGKTLTFITTGKSDGKKIADRILTANKLKLYRDQNPDFERFVCSVTAGSISRAMQRRQNPQLYRINLLRAERNDYHHVVELVPAYLPEDARDDIVQSIFTALLEGSIRRDQIKDRVSWHVKEHKKLFPWKYRKFGDSPLVSLDEVIFDDGGTTRGDRVSHGLWD